MQCACAVPSVARPALRHFPTLSRKRHDFRAKKKVTEHEMCVSSFSASFEAFFFLRITERVMIENVHCSSCKVPLVLV